MSRPLIKIEPESCSFNPTIQSIVVDLPIPFFPIKPNTSPLLTLKFKPLRTSFLFLPLP